MPKTDNTKEMVSLHFPESEHNYAAREDNTQTISIPGAKSIAIGFNDQTMFESGYDVLTIKDGQGQVIGQYTGTQLQAQTVTVPGDKILLHLASDPSNNFYGYKIVKIVADMP